MTAWHLITGEYPPARGGVADYSRQIAAALAREGDEVHVWVPAASGLPSCDPGVLMHLLPRGFGPRGLVDLGVQLRAQVGPRRLLVQYVPQAFGYRGMNVLFCIWLAMRKEPVWLMLHEVAVPWGWDRPLRHNVLGAVTRLMAAVAIKGSDRVFVSTSSWRSLLESFLSPPHVTWLPVPSNLPVERPAEREASVEELRRGRAVMLGHFGTYGEPIARLLRDALIILLSPNPGRLVLLLGRGSESFAAEFLALHPSLRSQIAAHGKADPKEVARVLSACDVMLQPYPDGVSGRRTTAMAGLALGVPVVTNMGPLTEDLWAESGAVALAQEASGAALAAVTETLLRDSERRRQVGERGRELYEKRFSLQRTIELLRNLAQDNGKSTNDPCWPVVNSGREGTL